MSLISRGLRSLRWRRNPIVEARAAGVRVGSDCRFLATSAATFGSEPYLITVGDHVTITGGVRFVTHDGGVWVLRDRHPDLDVIAPIVVGNNVFIGLGSIVLPGVTIGDNVVIGAGSVVNTSIPSNSIAAGVPARVLRSVEEYEAASLEKGVSTKGLAPAEKRERLLRQFGLQ